MKYQFILKEAYDDDWWDDPADDGDDCDDDEIVLKGVLADRDDGGDDADCDDADEADDENVFRAALADRDQQQQEACSRCSYNTRTLGITIVMMVMMINDQIIKDLTIIMIITKKLLSLWKWCKPLLRFQKANIRLQRTWLPNDK